MMVEDQKIDAALDPKALALPGRPRVVRILWEPVVDSVGEDSLYVWVVLDDSTSDEDRVWDVLQELEDVIRDALRELAEERFPYIYYRTESEMAEEQRRP